MLVRCAIALALIGLLSACGDSDRAPPPSLSGTATASPTASAAGSLSPGGREGVSFYGAEAGDRAGPVVSGDFNGDGRADILMAATMADGPRNARPDGGEAYLFLGPFAPGSSRDAAEGEFDLIIYGAAAGDQFGHAIAAADFNGDGTDDLALGAPFADPAERSDAGAVYVIFGSPELGRGVQQVDLATDAADASLLGGAAGDLAGFTLAAGRLDPDDRWDLVAGAFHADGPDGSRPDAGAAHIVYGASLRERIDFALGEEDVLVSGADAGDWLSEGLAAADINGDGLEDLVLAATFASGPSNDRGAAGEVYVVLSPLPPRIDLARTAPSMAILATDPGDQIGHAIAAGDTNGDGFADMWLGSVSADGPENGVDLAGEVRLVLGAAALPAFIDTRDTPTAALIYGPSQTARLGRSAASGDVDGDGLTDLLISAPNVEQRRGSVYVFLGRSNPASYPDVHGADFVITGRDRDDVLAHESFGSPALGAGDVTGDGRLEVLAAAPGGDGPRNDRIDAGEAHAVPLAP